jgi:hypothetical protein
LSGNLDGRFDLDMATWEPILLVGIAFIAGVFIFFVGAALTGGLLDALSLSQQRPRIITGWLLWYGERFIGGILAVSAYLALLEKHSAIGGPAAPTTSHAKQPEPRSAAGLKSKSSMKAGAPDWRTELWR